MNNLQVSSEVLEKAKKIKLLLMDCDGVLTDGRLYYSERGEELKVFNVKDGQGIVMWHQAGFQSGIISGRDSKIVLKRATELGMHYIKIGSRDKAKDFDEIFETTDFDPESVAYIGDDLPDIELMKKVGLAITVSDAVEDLKKFCPYISSKAGGKGAVREVIELLLSAKSFI